MSEEDDVARAIAMSMGMPPPPSDSSELGSLLEMGFSAEQARAALDRSGGREHVAAAPDASARRSDVFHGSLSTQPS